MSFGATSVASPIQGDGRIHGKLRKLRYRVSATTIRGVQRHA